ncbi:SANT/Myb domain [Dillenia turbinata]|uniref:SANT/Myb domain n=1 Tax=Dillenia turbinata TaxID=194707 RepID=A0AAN8UFY2_9MAGN
MTRRCSHCCNNGHNSRTCPTRAGSSSAAGGGSSGGSVGGVKLFGVRLTDGSFIKKSASMGSLSHYHSSSSAAASPNPSSPSSDPLRENPIPDGYLSDDTNHTSCSSNRRNERKKGVPWTEEEHRMFLIGLQKLGKGDWRGIAKNYVISRTPTQVASHAQKYFIRQSNATRRKRRSSLFDMVPDMATDTPPVPEEQLLVSPQAVALEISKSLPSLELSLNPEPEPMDTMSSEVKESEAQVAPSELPPMIPQYFPLPTFAFWPLNTNPVEQQEGETSHHEILKPIPVVPKEPVNVDELVGMSHLTLGEIERGERELSPLSLKLLGTPSRQSAFHVSTPVNASDLNNGKSNPIQAL